MSWCERKVRWHQRSKWQLCISSWKRWVLKIKHQVFMLKLFKCNYIRLLDLTFILSDSYLQQGPLQIGQNAQKRWEFQLPVRFPGLNSLWASGSVFQIGTKTRAKSFSQQLYNDLVVSQSQQNLEIICSRWGSRIPQIHFHKKFTNKSTESPHIDLHKKIHPQKKMQAVEDRCESFSAKIRKKHVLLNTPAHFTRPSPLSVWASPCCW